MSILVMIIKTPDPAGCAIARKKYYDDDSHTMVDNPYHDEEHYDYFYKSN